MTGLTTGFTTGSCFLIIFFFIGGGDCGFTLIGVLIITSGDGLRGFGIGRLIGFLCIGGGGESAKILNSFRVQFKSWHLAIGIFI